MRGNITRRGKHSWRLKFDVDADHGKRVTRYVTVKGRRADAEAELARLLNDARKGTLIDPTKMTLGEYRRSWLDSKTDISNVTKERYTEIIQNRISPMLGAIELQKLKPKHVQDWLVDLTKRGGRRYGQGLGPRSVRHCYRVLWGALKQAVKLEILSRNVADAATPPRLKEGEVRILDSRTDNGRQGRSRTLQARANSESRACYRMPPGRTLGSQMERCRWRRSNRRAVAGGDQVRIEV
jgi:Phage integrase, N-terminal SAM-like domain